MLPGYAGAIAATPTATLARDWVARVRRAAPGDRGAAQQRRAQDLTAAMAVSLS